MEKTIKKAIIVRMIFSKPVSAVSLEKTGLKLNLNFNAPSLPKTTLAVKDTAIRTAKIRDEFNKLYDIPTILPKNKKKVNIPKPKI